MTPDRSQWRRVGNEARPDDPDTTRWQKDKTYGSELPPPTLDEHNPLGLLVEKPTPPVAGVFAPDEPELTHHTARTAAKYD